MNLLHPIKNIMTRDVVTLPLNASIAEAAEVFKNQRIHHIPIVDGKKLVGIVSKSDYLFFRRGFLDNTEDQRLEQIRMNNYEVSYIMTKGLAKMEPDQKINVAIEIFKKNIFHAIPVIENETIVGIVTTYDIIKQMDSDRGVVNEYEVDTI